MSKYLYLAACAFLISACTSDQADTIISEGYLICGSETIAVYRATAGLCRGTVRHVQKENGLRVESWENCAYVVEKEFPCR